MSNMLPIQAVIPKQSIFQVPAQTSVQEREKTFGSFLKEAIQEVDTLQKVSDEATAKLVRGEKVDLHNVMVHAQKANIALTTTVEIRNKVVEAYQEISRMPL